MAPGNTSGVSVVGFAAAGIAKSAMSDMDNTNDIVEKKPSVDVEIETTADVEVAHIQEGGAHAESVATAESAASAESAATSDSLASIATTSAAASSSASVGDGEEAAPDTLAKDDDEEEVLMPDYRAEDDKQLEWSGSKACEPEDGGLAGSGRWFMASAAVALGAAMAVTRRHR